MKAEAIAEVIATRPERPSPFALISEFHCGYQQARRALVLAQSDAERQRFEGWLAEHSGYPSSRVSDAPDADYIDEATNEAWRAWQARAALS